MAHLSYPQGIVQVVTLTAPELITQFRQPDLAEASEVDRMVVARTIEQRAVLLSDDLGVRTMALAHHVPVIGTIGIFIKARFDGTILALKPLLDQLIDTGFYLEPQGSIYQDVLKHVDEE